MSPKRSSAGWASVVLAAAALLLADCGPATIESDEFSKFVTVNGTPEIINPLIGTKVEWRLQSFVAKDASRAVRHRLLVVLDRVDFFYKSEDSHEQLPFKIAADDSGTPIKVEPVAASTCGFGNGGCPRHQTVALPLADTTLRERVLSGYRIKIEPAEGDEPKILALTPAIIRHQLAMVDNLVQGNPTVPAQDKPRLGIGVIAATATPFAGPPRGVIVVELVPNSSAESGGVRAGDILLAIDAQPIRVSNDMARIMDGLTPGHTITLELQRAGKPVTAMVQL